MKNKKKEYFLMKIITSVSLLSECEVVAQPAHSMYTIICMQLFTLFNNSLYRNFSK